MKADNQRILLVRTAWMKYYEGRAKIDPPMSGAKYIKENPSVIKKGVAEKLLKLKQKYTLILVTTNTEDYIDKILEVSKLNNIFYQKEETR